MKCKHCNGTGKVRGYFYEKTGVNKWEKVWGDSPCDECNGTGEIEVEMTNEEWFCQLSTEEKAEWVTKNLSVYADDWVKSDEKLLSPATWVDWLNEVHK